MQQLSTVAAEETTTTRTARRLDELGPTADDVADKLRALGIKGELEHSNACPVANYLGRDTTLTGVEVLETVAEVWVGHPDLAVKFEVPVPPPVEMFIRRFDAGVYLDLVAA